jgi:transposase-like protein
MQKHCPYCSNKNNASDSRTKIIRAGYFKRKSDCRRIQRFRCLQCLRYFSNATFHPCFGQKKRQVNFPLIQNLCSTMSLRRSAKVLCISRRTLARKLIFLGDQARLELAASNLSQPKAEIVEFDDMETFEHTKCKPISITLAVEHKSRRILGFTVSQMPAKGLIARRSRKKYGPRRDERTKGRHDLFSAITPLVLPTAVFKSDQNPYYPKDLKIFFPDATHEQFKGQRGSIVGQGELKKVRFDPLFSLNHTCAMLRANISRLIRKTWCTTKLPQRLADHIAIYALYHNLNLIKANPHAG